MIPLLKHCCHTRRRRLQLFLFFNGWNIWINSCFMVCMAKGNVIIYLHQGWNRRPSIHLNYYHHHHHHLNRALCLRPLHEPSRHPVRLHSPNHQSHCHCMPFCPVLNVILFIISYKMFWKVCKHKQSSKQSAIFSKECTHCANFPEYYCTQWWNTPFLS